MICAICNWNVDRNGRFCLWKAFCLKCIEKSKNSEALRNSEFVRWEEVEVRDDRHNPDDLDASHKGKFICEIEHEYKYVVEMEMSDWPLCRKYIRKLPKQEAWSRKFTREEVNRAIEEENVCASYDEEEAWRFVLRVLERLGMLEE